MLLAALDLNADRVRGLRGLAGQRPQPIYWDSQDHMLPLAISMADRALQVGRAALARSRQSPQVVCSGFLPLLGENRRWQHGRHRLDPLTALAAVCGKVREALSGIQSLA